MEDYYLKHVYSDNQLSDKYLDERIKECDLLLVSHFILKGKELEEYLDAIQEKYDITHLHIYHHTNEMTIGVKKRS